MRTLKWLLAGAVVGVILVAFRDFEQGTWLPPARRPGAAGEDDDESETEPVLGYDGMDQDTLIEWLAGAELDRGTLDRMRRYEEAHLGREPVLAAISDLM